MVEEKCVFQRQRSAVEDSEPTAPRVKILSPACLRTKSRQEQQRVWLAAGKEACWLAGTSPVLQPHSCGAIRYSSRITSAFSCASDAGNPCVKKILVPNGLNI